MVAVMISSEKKHLINDLDDIALIIYFIFYTIVCNEQNTQ